MADPLRTIIVDDEVLARERLLRLCESCPDLSVVATAAGGPEALALVARHTPDLVLLDIAMPGPDGLAVARTLADRPTPPVILFCTAHDGFAVAAFDIAAADYLLKPVSAERLARGVARARAALVHRGSARSPWTDEFWVPVRSELVRIAAGEIDRIDAERDYMRLRVGGRSYLLHATIAALERRLDPACFVRVHRSTILRRDRIMGLRHEGLGWHIDVADGGTVRIGRTYLAAVRAMMER